jgi:AraC-like DNA-binding protein/hemoglobin-like flavoprotein
MVRKLGVTALPPVRMFRAEQKLGGLLESYLRCLARLDGRLARTEGPQLIEHFCGLLAISMQVSVRSPPQAKARARSSQLDSIRDCLEQHLGDPTLSPESVSTRFGISTRYLHKLHSDQGQSFSRWLLQRRLERFRRELDDPVLGERSIAELALSCGFNDLTHFGRCFRAAYGLSPREWRGFGPVRGGGRSSGAGNKLRSAPIRGVPAGGPCRPLGTTSGGWLSPAQVSRLRGQFGRVAEQSPSFAAAFYERFFALAPQLRSLFRGSLPEQSAKLMRMIALLVTRADMPDSLAEPLAQLGARHVAYGVAAADFEPMCEALLATLDEYLPGDFDAEARRAWTRLFDRVVALMQPSAEARRA